MHFGFCLSCPSRCLGLCFYACLWTGWALSHPLQTEPVRHPQVAGFDAYFLSLDPDETLVRGGLLLMAELSCTACHTAPQRWQSRLLPRPGPRLETVGSRFNEDTLWRMVRSPQHRKPGTLMPGLFGAAPGDAERVEALTRYLATLEGPVKPMPKGDVDRGRTLYHAVGCVACHQPATDFFPAGVASAAEAEPLSTTSSPLALADVWELQALGRFLLDPLTDRPAGRMPSLRLTEQEAADVAAYLHTDRTPEKAVERAALQISGQTAEMGRHAFQEMRCANCHSTGEAMTSKPARPLVELNLGKETSCLSAVAAPGIPRFDFSEVQQRALALALAHVQACEPAAESAGERIEWQLLRLNCVACHDRLHKGGPEDARAAYFGSGPDRFPPSLDGVGAKFAQDVLLQVLHGDYSPTRTGLSVRMPDFGRSHAQVLSEAFMTADKPTN